MQELAVLHIYKRTHKHTQYAPTHFHTCITGGDEIGPLCAGTATSLGKLHLHLHLLLIQLLLLLLLLHLYLRLHLNMHLPSFQVVGMYDQNQNPTAYFPEGTQEVFHTKISVCPNDTFIYALLMETGDIQFVLKQPPAILPPWRGGAFIVT